MPFWPRDPAARGSDLSSDVMRLSPNRLSNLERDGLTMLGHIRRSVGQLSEHGILDESEKRDFDSIIAEIERGLKFALEQSQQD